ncbi:MAG: hydantoinase/carbamoylase family amidase [Gemmatimonadota bacterium]
MPITLEQLNAAPQPEFVRLLAGAYDLAWVATSAWQRRPFASLAQLKLALVTAVREAGRDAQLELIRAQPEPDAAALPSAGADDAARLRRLSADYRAKFGFPFVLALRGPRGKPLGAARVIAALERRLDNHPDFEFAEALRHIHRIAELRLGDAFGHVPALGNQVLDWADDLAQHSDPGFAEKGQLTVTYLTAAHRACAQQIEAWMREDCGFDSVHVDAVGNVVGLYHGTTREAKRLLTGSHFDTVRNGGRYDGRLGILVPILCVRELARAGRRLPYGIEVVAFAEEEGQRYRTAFLASSALTGSFDAAWLDQGDADGVTLREAMQRAGLPIDEIPALRRDPSRYLGYVEVHIEQGPVLNEMDLPLGVVTSINGNLRYGVEIVGVASHAGTTPMDRRRDAAAAAAELVLYIEKRAAAQPHLVGTVGMLDVPGGSINVVPGRCRFSVDIRSNTDAVRDAAANDVLAELERICARRGLRYRVDATMRVPAAPCTPAWQRRWERAVESLGLPVHRMPSGAGHDAMKLANIMPQAMLFMRGLNSGISHNPLEAISNDDAELVVRAFQNLLEQLAAEPG